MPDERYSPKDALAAVRDRDLEDWLNSWWDLLCAALNHYQETLDPNDEMEVHTLEAIRRVRMEIVVGNRLSDAIAHKQDQLSDQPLLAGQTELPNICQSEGARG